LQINVRSALAPEIVARLHAVGKFASLSITIFVVLTVLLEQTLTQRGADLAQRDHRVRSLAQSILVSRQSVAESYSMIWGQVRRLPYQVLRLEDSVPSPTPSPSKQALDSTEVRLARMYDTTTRRLKRTDGFREVAQSDPSASDFDRVSSLCFFSGERGPVEGATPKIGAPRAMRSLRSPQTASSEVAALCTLRSGISFLRAINVPQLSRARVRLDTARARYSAVSRERAQLRLARGAIPTPFGSFDLNPAFGLLAVGWAGLISFLVFVSSAMIAQQAIAAAKPKGPDSSYPLQVPFWLVLPSQPKKQAWPAYVFVIVWLIVAGVIIADALLRWRAQSFVGLPVPGLWTTLSIALVGLSASVAWEYCTPASSDATVTSSRKQITRRVFVATAIAGVAVMPAGVRWVWRRYKTSTLSSVRRPIVTLSGSLVRPSPEWIVTKPARKGVRGVLHHRTLCSGHLPTKRNSQRFDGSLDQVSPHLRGSVHMIERLANELVDRNELASAIQLYKYAIQLSPDSFHLYDRLVRLYGRTKQFAEIRPLLTNARDSLTADVPADSSRGSYLSRPSLSGRVTQRAIKRAEQREQHRRARAREEFEKRLSSLDARIARVARRAERNRTRHLGK
jgi:hypothetical protein